MISLATAAVIYLALFPVLGYLAIPAGVVASGYLKNYLLGRACRKRGLFKMDMRSVRTIAAFGLLAAALGVALWFVPIDSIWTLFAAIAAYGIIYLPIAYVIDRKL